MAEIIELRSAVVKYDHKWTCEKKRHHALVIFDFLDSCFKGYNSPDLRPNSIQLGDIAIIESHAKINHEFPRLNSVLNFKKDVK